MAERFNLEEVKAAEEKVLPDYVFSIRHIFCTLITNINSALNGTDLIILAHKKTEPPLTNKPQ